MFSFDELLLSGQQTCPQMPQGKHIPGLGVHINSPHEALSHEALSEDGLSVEVTAAGAVVKPTFTG